MSLNARISAPHGRKMAVSFCTAAGAAVIAASFSLGTAPVAGADVSDADAVSSLVGALDPSALSAASLAEAALPAATETVPVANAISYLIDALDPAQFTATGAPAGVFGLVGYYLDFYLFGPTSIDPAVDAFLEPYVVDLVNSLGSTAASAATAGVDPVSELVGAFDPGAFGAFDSVVDGLLGSATLF
ncbi:hypothetical protein [Mycobacterium cookii]|uniref:hypothetical protein n=1 Tax=Mycobacterium cookii TaxID=1775 RepID=UPI0013D62336|nr:hypothetical protein [Mycobacterium cookii]MCV7331113.1 hypothetical protein [Mycobacterium cookii]